MVTFKGSRPQKAGLDEREKAFEAKYHLDEEMTFKSNVRRAKLMGLWAADLMGLAGDEAGAYARLAVEADMTDPGHGGLLKKLRTDLAAKGLGVSAEQLDEAMSRLQQVARQQIMAEVAAGKQAISAK